MLQNVKKALANSEPSTHGPSLPMQDAGASVAIGYKADVGLCLIK